MQRKTIAFKHAEKFNYKGPNDIHVVPTYAPETFKIDFEKLVDFLSQKGTLDYNYELFRSYESEVNLGADPSTVTHSTDRIDLYINDVVEGELRTIRMSAKLNTKVGKIDTHNKYALSLLIDPHDTIDRYSIYIPYSGSSQPYSYNDVAIILSVSDFYELNYLVKRLHHILGSNEQWIFDQFEKAFSSYRSADELDFLYEQAPIWLVAKRNNDKVFEDLKILLGSSVNSVGTNEEIAVLNIIRSFATFPYYDNYLAGEAELDLGENTTYLLEKSATEKVNGETVFERLYKVMHDYGGEDNFTAFIQLYYIYWLESDYSKNETADHPLILDYKSSKTHGFYSTDKLFHLDGNRISISAQKKNPFYARQEDTAPEYTWETVKILHIYDAINAPNLQQQDGEITSMSNVVPAFFLKAFDDKNAWSNLEKAAWLTLDVITLFSGVGNLLKLRHLTKVFQAYKYFKMTVAGIEVVSSSVALMLNFVNECDDQSDDTFCAKLRTVLIYIDLGTLGIDAIVARYLRKAANDARRNMPNALREEHPEIFEELTNIARGSEITEATRNSIIQILRKHNLTPRFNRKTVDLYDVDGNFIFRLDPNELDPYFVIVALTRKELRNRIRNVNRTLRNSSKRFRPDSDAARHFGVKPSKNEFGIDFKRTKNYIYQRDSIVRIKLTGSRNKDFDKCRQLLSEKTGMSIDEIIEIEEAGYTWHHLDDLNEDLECTMQLVDSNAHSPLHIGSCGQFTELTGIKYKT